MQIVQGLRGIYENGYLFNSTFIIDDFIYFR
jgi:hypothetical protein